MSAVSLLSVNAGFLLQGLLVTLLLSGATVAAATVVASVLAAGIGARRAAVRWPAKALVEILRDIPLFVLVMLVYFVLPAIGVDVDAFTATVLSLSAWGGANGATVIHAGLRAVPLGQVEAARSLGLRGLSIFRLVVLPQALRPILPPYLGLVTQLVQSTSIGALIGVRELLRSGQIVIERTTVMDGGSPSFLIYAVMLAVYFLICSALARFSAAAEAALARHELPATIAVPPPRPRLAWLRARRPV